MSTAAHNLVHDRAQHQLPAKLFMRKTGRLSARLEVSRENRVGSEFGRRVRHLREQCQLSQEALAGLAGISRRWLASIDHPFRYLIAYTLSWERSVIRL